MIRTVTAATALAAVFLLAACSGDSGGASRRVVLSSAAEHVAFPIGPTDKHGSTTAPLPDCFACHALMVAGVAQPPPSLKVYTCTGCHVPAGAAGTLHDNVAAMRTLHLARGAITSTSTMTDADCARCHGDGTVPVTVSGHLAKTGSFPIGAGSYHTGDAGLDCLKCHPAYRSAPKSFAADFKQYACDGCHTTVATDPSTSAAVDHTSQVLLAGYHEHVSAVYNGAALTVASYNAAVTAAGGLSQACLHCHPDGTGAPPDHVLRFPTPHPGRTAGSVAACSDCHTVANSKADVTTLGCAGCHATMDVSPTPAIIHAGVATYASVITSPPSAGSPTQGSAQCVRCHAQASNVTPPTIQATLQRALHLPFLVAPTTAVPSPWHAASSLTGGDCFGCHPNQGVAANATTGAPAKPWAQDFKTTTCVGCHVTVYFPEPPAVPTVNADHTDPNQLATLHYTVSAVATTADYLAAVAAAGSLSAACLGCHGDGTSAAVPPDHSQKYFPLPHPNQAGKTNATCLQCHTDPTSRGDVTKQGCAGCHAAVDVSPTLATLHQKVATYAAVIPVPPSAGAPTVGSPQCLRCHPMADHQSLAVHTPFLLANTATVTTVKHLSTDASATGGGDCFSCHPTQGTPATATAPAKAYAQDFKSYRCDVCHVTVAYPEPPAAPTTTADHTNQAQLATLHVANGGVGTEPAFTSAVTTAGSLTAACIGCHSDGTAAAMPTDHPTMFPLPHPGATGSPSTAGCSDCHTDPAHRNDPTKLDCYTCHHARPTFAAAHPTGTYKFLNIPPCTNSQQSETASCTATTFSVASSPSCLTCHAPTTINPADPLIPRWLPGSGKTPVHTSGSRSMNSDKHPQAGCLVCHTATRNVPPTGVVVYLAADFTQNTCLVCHPLGAPH
jgi:hypothetical protein